MSRHLPAFILAISLVFFLHGSALADNCNVDCNKKCCQTVRITPWDKNTICEPACKSSCEATKFACMRIDSRIPAISTPNTIAAVTKLLQTSCASAFQAINTAVTIHQGPYSAGSDAALYYARDLLIRAGFFTASDFANVRIRWGNLVGDGQTPDRILIFINQRYLVQSPTALYSIAVTIGHEMTHVMQYRRIGTDTFKCQYSRTFLDCGACQDNRHPLEREAYDWNRANNDRVAHILGLSLR